MSLQAIGLFQTPVTANIDNVGSGQVATSQDNTSSVVDVSIIVRDSSIVVADVNCQEWLMTQASEGSDMWTIQNKTTSKYAHPQGDPALDVSVVEDANSYQWKIVSADDGEGGNLISASDANKVEYYWGIAANSADKSDIKLRADNLDKNNHWRTSKVPDEPTTPSTPKSHHSDPGPHTCGCGDSDCNSGAYQCPCRGRCISTCRCPHYTG